MTQEEIKTIIEPTLDNILLNELMIQKQIKNGNIEAANGHSKHTVSNLKMLYSIFGLDADKSFEAAKTIISSQKK